MVNNILEKSFIFGAMLFSIAYNSNTLGMGSSPEEHNTNSFNTIVDNNEKSINSSILTDSSSQIKMRFGKKDKDKDWIQVTMPIYNLKCNDKTGERLEFLSKENIPGIGIFDIDLKNTAVILERDQFVVKLNVGGGLKYELLDTIKTQASRFMNYVNGEIDEYKDLSRISRTEYEHKYDVTTCITIPGLQIDCNIKKPALNIYNEKFVVQRNFLDRFLSFGEKFKVNFSKSLGFYSNDIFTEILKNDKVLFKFKGSPDNIDMKSDVNFSMTYNMFYMNLMNVLTDFSIGRLQVDLNIFHTKLRKKIITKYFKFDDGKPININEDIIDENDNTKTHAYSATNFSLYCKLSNEGDESNNWINYDVELSGIFNVKSKVNFEKYLILPRKPKDYEDFIQNIKPLKSYDDHQPLIYKDSNRRLKVYFNGVFSLKRIEFLHNNVAFAISLVDFSFGIHSQGYIQEGDFSVFKKKKKIDDSIFAIYVRPFIIKMELIKDGIIVVNWTPFTWGNRLDKNDMQFSKNLKASLNLNKLYHWIFGKENVV